MGGPIKASTSLIKDVVDSLKKNELSLQIAVQAQGSQLFFMDKKSVKIKNRRKTISKFQYDPKMKLVIDGNNSKALTFYPPQKQPINFICNTSLERDQLVALFRIKLDMAIHHNIRNLNEETACHLAQDSVAIRRQRSSCIFDIQSIAYALKDCDLNASPENFMLSTVLASKKNSTDQNVNQNVDEDGYTIPKEIGFDNSFDVVDSSESECSPKKIDFRISENSFSYSSPGKISGIEGPPTSSRISRKMET